MEIEYKILIIQEKEISVPNDDYYRNSETHNELVKLAEEIYTDEIKFTTEQEAETWLINSKMKGEFIIQKTYIK